MMPVNDDHKKPGIKRPYFPLPAIPEPENYQCIKLSIPDDDDYRVAFISALQMLTYWFNWERNEAKTGTIVASVWREVVNHMSFKDACCCDEGLGPETRFTEEGVLEVYDTDTETWEPYPEGDTRERSTQFPPLPGPDGSTKACMAAENIVAIFENNVAQLVSDLAVYTSIGAFAIAVGGMVAVFLSLGALAPAVAGLATAAFAAGASGIGAAFSSEVWDRFKCNLYCHMNETGKVGVSDLAAIKAQVETDETGIASTILRKLIDNYGIVGMNNLAATASAGDGDTCGECGCEEWCWYADFRGANARGFTIYNPTEHGTTTLTASGYTAGIDSTNSLKYAACERTFDTTTITRIVMDYSIVIDDAGTSFNKLNFELWLDDVRVGNVDLPISANATDAEWDNTVDNIVCNKVYFTLSCGAFEPYGSGSIHAVRFEGTGEPIDFPNCDIGDDE